ncbi:sialin-like isoform X1 [Harmonia axyridis]|uniref:sialin-like isoform X1 n=2 Tax=Harmonia axyridis TaxID=115357 RepID=UPI001E278A4C|nr:sialin-like isoform X1 [Harmonia axyridis]
MALKKPPYRVLIAMMVLWTTALNYCFRTFFPVTLIAMLDRNKTVKLENGTETSQMPPDYGPRYPWTPFQEGQLIGAYFYGYSISSLPGGPIAEYFGPYWTVIVSSLICAAITSASVFAVMENWVPLFVCRLLVGLSGGVQYPSLQCLMGAWAPPNEKGKFTACLMGNVLGSVITQSIVGFLVSTMGWTWGFYFTGMVSALFLIGWVLLVSDYPEQNWFCGAEEVAYIKESHAGSVKIGKSKPPILQILTSIPFLSLVIGQFGSLWGLYLLLTVVPKFMADVLKFNLKGVGFLSSTPGISRLISGFIFGAIADFFIKRELVKKVVVRKGFITFSHFLPGIVMFLYLAIEDNVPIAVALLIIMMAFNGACVVTTIVNPQDLAPNYAGTQFGIMNFFGSMPGFIIPAMVGELTKYKSELPEWAVIFGITGIIYISSGIVFVLFGSADLQPWNEKRETGPAQGGS